MNDQAAAVPTRSRLRAVLISAGLVALAVLGAAAAYRIGLAATGQAVYIERSDGMAPTLVAGDRFRVALHAYDSADPARCEIVAFAHPAKPDKLLVSRVLGLPGDRIAIRDGAVWIGDRVFQVASSAGAVTYHNAGMLGPGDVVAVPADSVFVLSDSSGEAIDSRFFGAVPWGG